MKTVKQLAQDFLEIKHTDTKEISEFLRQLCDGMVIEAKRLSALRNSKDNKKIINVLKELDHKWMMFVKRVNNHSPFIDIQGEGFTTYLQKIHPQLYKVYDAERAV